MQIRTRIDLTRPENDFEKNLEDELTRYTQDLARLLNTGLKFSENFNAQIKEYTTNGSADTEDTVSHTLGRAPTGFLILNRDKAGIVYDSGTAWTASNLYLKCNVASVAVKIMIF
jgi:hypothetical protein